MPPAVPTCHHQRHDWLLWVCGIVHEMTATSTIAGFHTGSGTLGGTLLQCSRVVNAGLIRDAVVKNVQRRFVARML